MTACTLFVAIGSARYLTVICHGPWLTRAPEGRGRHVDRSEQIAGRATVRSRVAESLHRTDPPSSTCWVSTRCCQSLLLPARARMFVRVASPHTRPRSVGVLGESCCCRDVDAASRLVEPGSAAHLMLDRLGPPSRSRVSEGEPTGEGDHFVG